MSSNLGTVEQWEDYLRAEVARLFRIYSVNGGDEAGRLTEIMLVELDRRTLFIEELRRELRDICNRYPEDTVALKGKLNIIEVALSKKEMGD
jgi:hypothetical protein